MHLDLGDYLVVITTREKVTTLNDQDIFRASSFRVLPLVADLKSLSDLEAADEKNYIQLLETHLQTNTFYFSYHYDLTQTLQRQANLKATSAWQRADERFFWNYYLSDKLIKLAATEEQVGDYVLPVMQGFVETFEFTLHGRSLSFALVTRRSRHRAGTRYFSRGIDADGYVSNYNETEQIITLLDEKSGKVQAAYVQTRGSIPVKWGQVNNIKYTPRLMVYENKHGVDHARKHFDAQVAMYGTQVLVNLVNTKGYETPMGQAYAKVVEQLNNPQLRYIHFDFHKECSKMRYSRISLLIDDIGTDMDKIGYFQSAGSPPKLQQGVIRTNCMDCLDRTNVVQSALALYVLHVQLRSLGVLTADESLEKHEDFISKFRNIWADNADAVSIVYAGSGALKTDFTRTGKRSKAGSLQDGVNSLTRYVKNNFMDGRRQDGFDLVLGRFRVGINKPVSVSLTGNKPLRVRVVPYIIPFAFVMLFLTVFFHESLGTTYPRFYTLFWMSVIISAFRFVFQNGVDFVQWPLLVDTGYLTAPTLPGIGGSDAPEGGLSTGMLNLDEGVGPDGGASDLVKGTTTIEVEKKGFGVVDDVEIVERHA